jgi:hypothetical protein
MPRLQVGRVRRRSAIITRGLRRIFNDLAHVTEKMREHYSSVDLAEKREAVAAVVRLVPVRISAESGADREQK